mmetsp:Transcript_255/g.645  ORF Transcript_255/g.645 Transcript_255/m.645 type:complete len:202 (-) Transcript_255:358-963(-)
MHTTINSAPKHVNMGWIPHFSAMALPSSGETPAPRAMKTTITRVWAVPFMSSATTRPVKTVMEAYARGKPPAPPSNSLSKACLGSVMAPRMQHRTPKQATPMSCTFLKPIRSMSWMTYHHTGIAAIEPTALQRPRRDPLPIMSFRSTSSNVTMRPMPHPIKYRMNIARRVAQLPNVVPNCTKFCRNSAADICVESGRMELM